MRERCPFDTKIQLTKNDLSFFEANQLRIEKAFSGKYFREKVRSLNGVIEMNETTKANCCAIPRMANCRFK